MSDASFSIDKFLGGSIRARQPIKGFRAGHDTVLLAAAVPAKEGERALELGAGVGIASLCLAARVLGVDVTGIEIDDEMVRFANENAGLNAFSHRVRFAAGDVGALAASEAYDHVFFNPPFHPDTGQRSPSSARDRATRDHGRMLGRWTMQALAMVHDNGTVTAILRSDRQDEILEQTRGHGVIVFPLFPREGEVAKRVIVQIRKDSGPAIGRARGLILHESDGRNSNEAEAVLRHGAALALV